jgi:hypothetical protein
LLEVFLKTEKHKFGDNSSVGIVTVLMHVFGKALGAPENHMSAMNTFEMIKEATALIKIKDSDKSKKFEVKETFVRSTDVIEGKRKRISKTKRLAGGEEDKTELVRLEDGNKRNGIFKEGPASEWVLPFYINKDKTDASGATVNLIFAAKMIVMIISRLYEGKDAVYIKARLDVGINLCLSSWCRPLGAIYAQTLKAKGKSDSGGKKSIMSRATIAWQYELNGLHNRDKMRAGNFAGTSGKLFRLKKAHGQFVSASQACDKAEASRSKAKNPNSTLVQNAKRTKDKMEAQKLVLTRARDSYVKLASNIFQDKNAHIEEGWVVAAANLMKVFMFPKMPNQVCIFTPRVQRNLLLAQKQL